jgi:hypothetical protein
MSTATAVKSNGKALGSLADQVRSGQLTMEDAAALVQAQKQAQAASATPAPAEPEEKAAPRTPRKPLAGGPKGRSVVEILPDVATGKIKPAEAQAEIAKATATAKGLSVCVSAKGALSVYGMGQWPLTLYVEQWERLSAVMDEILLFGMENAALLSRKADK